MLRRAEYFYEEGLGRRIGGEREMALSMEQVKGRTLSQKNLSKLYHVEKFLVIKLNYPGLYTYILIFEVSVFMEILLIICRTVYRRHFPPNLILRNFAKHWIYT